MVFILNKDKPQMNYVPIYSIEDMSFNTIPEVPSDFSIMVKGNYTSLDVSLNTSTICCISGFNPQNTWIKSKLAYPNFIKCAVQVGFDNEPQIGTGIDYALNWKTYYDSDEGVVCIGTHLLPTNSVNVEFNNNTGMSIVGGKIISLWIKPRFV